MKININIGEILSKSGQIIWKFKVLWIFGILAGCGGNNGSRFNYNGGSSGRGGSGDGGDLPEFLRQFQNMRPEQAVREFLNQYFAVIAGIILVLCVLWALFYFLGLMGRIGLIKGASLADAGTESLTFGEIWTESTPHVWRMLGLNLLVGLPFFLLLVILIGGLAFAGFSTFSNGDRIGAMFLGLLGVFVVIMCVISLIASIVGMIVEQAQNALVLENLGVLESLGRGWSVFKTSFLTVILMAVILWVIDLIIGLVIAIPFIVIAIPMAIGVATAGSENFIIPLALAGGCFLLYLPVLLILSGILQAYTQSVWTLTYRRLTDLEKPVLPAQMDVIEAQ